MLYVSTLPVQQVADGPNEPNPSYAYTYDIKSSDTYDMKSHSESRRDNVTIGEFSVIQPDGIRRTTRYRADPINGFVAEVSYEKVMEPFPELVKTKVFEIVKEPVVWRSSKRTMNE